jgi:uncharacterized protein YqeY
VQEDLQRRLRNDLTEAMRARNGRTVRVLRTVLSAIANAEAQPPAADVSHSERSAGGIAGAADGLAATDVARRDLSEQELRAIVAAEQAERLAAADDLTTRGAPEAAADLRVEAALLEHYLSD